MSFIPLVNYTSTGPVISETHYATDIVIYGQIENRMKKQVNSTKLLSCRSSAKTVDLHNPSKPNGSELRNNGGGVPRLVIPDQVFIDMFRPVAFSVTASIKMPFVGV
jgi:hypothetical protein